MNKEQEEMIIEAVRKAGPNDRILIHKKGKYSPVIQVYTKDDESSYRKG